MNPTIRKAMFRGTKLFRGFKKVLHKRQYSFQPDASSRRYLRAKLMHYHTKKNPLVRWRQSKKRFSVRRLSKLLSKRTGTRVQVRATNVFTYLLKKAKEISFSKSQKHI